VDFGGERGRPKRERNMALLRTLLEKEPDNLLVRLQCVESSAGKEQEEFLRAAVAGVEEKLSNWENIGPAIYRYAVAYANAFNLPDYDQWEARSLELFPNSMFTRIDTGALRFQRAIDAKRYGDAIPIGKDYLRALREYRSGENRKNDLLFSSLMSISASKETEIRINLADALYEEGRYAEARGLLPTVDFQGLSDKDFMRCVTIGLNIQAHSKENIGQVMQEYWARIQDAPARQKTLSGISAVVFSPDYLKMEEEGGLRHAYTAFLPLEGKCMLGDAAALMEKDKPAALDKILARYPDWSALPNVAVVKALERGAAVPVMTVEEMEKLVNHFVSEKVDITALALRASERPDSDAQALCWARTLMLVAVRSYAWSGGERDMVLAKAFVRVEREFISHYYAPELLNEPNLPILPSMHRFGWYCIRAFDAKEAGDRSQYVKLLRAGLNTCPQMKKMVDALLNRLEQERHHAVIATAPPELMALAEQVRSLLNSYPSNDPAVAALKQSDAYQKVAWLIEDPPMLMAGGIAQ